MPADETKLTVLEKEPASPAAGAAAEVEQPTLASRYQLLGLVGTGAMGCVYRARDLWLDETIAVKTLSPMPSLSVIRAFVAGVHLLQS